MTTSNRSIEEITRTYEIAVEIKDVIRKRWYNQKLFKRLTLEGT